MAWAIEAGKFKKIVSLLQKIGVREVSLYFDPKEGLRISEMEPSKVGMVKITLPIDKFVSYDDEDFHFPTCIDSLLVMKLKATDEIWFGCEDGRALCTIKNGSREKKYKMPLIDRQILNIPEPTVEFKAKVVVDAKEIIGALDDARTFATHYTIRADREKEALIIRAVSSKGAYEYYADRSDAESPITGFEAKDSTVASYDAEMTKALLSAAEDSIILWLASDAPLKVEYGTGDFHVVGWLAPRVEL